MDVSIIIPCYNSGKYLPDAIDSVIKLDGLDKYQVEAIVVDDGSTDAATIEILRGIKDPMFAVVYRENGGPAAARNTGIAHAGGKYFVFLDADNCLKPDFVTACLEAVETQNADIIHAKAEFFGESTQPRFNPAPFDLHKIIAENYIDMCFFISREAFERAGKLDEERLIIGFEDWEFILRAYGAGLAFYFLDRVLFKYRIVGTSLSQTHHPDRINKVKMYIYQKNISLVLESMSYYRECERIRERDMSNKLRFIVKILYRWIWPKQ